MSKRRRNPSHAHERVAKKLAKKYGAEYPPRAGVDVVTNNIAIEVETLGGVKQGIQQLQGHKKRAYIAGVNKATVQEAMAATEGTTIGVIDKDGNVVKPSTRKK